MRVVLDAKLVGYRQQKRVGFGDRFVFRQFFDKLSCPNQARSRSSIRAKMLRLTDTRCDAVRPVSFHTAR